jgi:hypothetical protein
MRPQVEALLDVDALIDGLASAMAELSAGRASVLDRVAALVPEREGLEAEVGAVSSYHEALDGVDIACATTHAIEPVIRRSWLSPRVHVTSVGYNRGGREVDDATVVEALVAWNPGARHWLPPHGKQRPADAHSRRCHHCGSCAC